MKKKEREVLEAAIRGMERAKRIFELLSMDAGCVRGKKRREKGVM